MTLANVVVWMVLAQAGGMGSSPGSVFIPSARLADMMRDVRASQIDDIVTIIVTENASAAASGATKTARKSSAKNNITALGGTLPAQNRFANLAGVSNDQQLEGTGQTSRNMTLTTTVSARVIEVTPAGSLLVEGAKDLMVNSERQTVVIRGLVRPEDLSTANTVPSTRVANLTIQVNGKGVVGDAIKRPFFLYRLLLGLLPF
jgi:flagellar L-ring protein precursor FlgH